MNKLRYPGSCEALSITASKPPATLIPKTITTNNAIVITILCIRSVILAARNPPSAQ